ncbi:MAG TPA: DUF4198 domain-containing protein [Paenibacillus sp.]|nr:DUF4198 domain-containing protein [Paenibacillus sp.]
MKKTITAALAAALLTTSSVASAHDGWAQTAPIVAAGEVAYVELLFGNHSNEHGSYRIEGNWNEETTKTYAVTPAGDKIDVTGTTFYTGEVVETDNAKINNGYVATFSALTPGAYIVSVEGDSVFAHGGVASRTLRSAKSFVAVADVPLLRRVQDLRGFGKVVSPDRAEWVPASNPAAAATGGTVSARLMLKGEPLAGVEATLVRRSTSEAERLTTDAEGYVTFEAGPADYYLLRAKPATDEKVEGEYESTNYEATMTFVVQNARAAAPKGEPASSLPTVYVDGKEADATEGGLRLADGSLRVDAAWLGKATGRSIDAAGEASLRAAAEAAGVAVEYFPAVGGVPAAVHLYAN